MWAGQAPVTGASATGTAAGAAAGTARDGGTPQGLGNTVPLGLSMGLGGHAGHGAAGLDFPLSLGGDVEVDVRALMVHCRHYFQVVFLVGKVWGGCGEGVEGGVDKRRWTYGR